MESQSQKITSLIEEMLPLLKMSDTRLCAYYHDFLDNILVQLKRPHELHKIAENILKIYGGMATFSDVLIYKNKEILMVETEKFEDLSDALFMACKEAVAASRGATS